MAETEYPTHDETYDPRGPQSFIQKIESQPNPNEKFRKAAIARAANIYENGQLGRFIQQEDKVFYLGAGLGYVAQTIERQTQAQVFKLDLYDIRASDTKDQKFVQATARALPIKSEACDVIVLNDVLHHCLKPEEILTEAYRVLKPGGKVIIIEDTMPEQNQPLRRTIIKKLTSLEDDFLNQQAAGINPHNYFSINEWKKMFALTGFSDQLDIKYWYWGLQDFLPGQKVLSPQATRSVGRPFESTRFVLTKQ